MDSVSERAAAAQNGGDITITYDARGLVELDGTIPKISEIDGERAQFDAKELSTRKINAELKWLLYEQGVRDVTILNPSARHSLGVGILMRCKITFEGSLGYFGCGLIDGAEVQVNGRVGWSVAENMMSGVVVIESNAGSLAGAALRGGDLVVKGQVGARTGIDQKGGTILVMGSAGSMTGFMMQRGRQIICGDVGPGLGDSMYDGTLYVAGKVAVAGDRLRRGRVDRRRHRADRAQVLDLRPRHAARVHQVRVRQEALQLRQPRAEREEAGPVTPDENAPSSKTVLGRSKIFTPEVIDDIHMKAELGRYRMRGFSMFKKIPHWDELIFLPGTLTRFVIEGYREKCETKTVLGARFAKKPIELDIPVYITGMSFGALSLEAKMALAKGASMAGTATCSGEGGMIPPERDLSTKWYYQIIQSRYGFNPHHLMLADAVEFFIGQGCKVGLGGHLMGQKVTEQVAEMRSLPAGIDQRSPARHPDWLGPDDLSLKVQETREATNYEIPIQLKLGAARVYDDVRMAAKCGPDIIYLDGAEGGTGAGPHTAAEETGIPLMAAIPEARRALEDVGLADEIDLVVAGGIRNGGDVAKCIALGATAVAIGHSALMALNCNKEIPGVTDYEGTIGVPAGQCYHCHTGRCPVGITTQDPELRKRLNVEEAANRVYNFLHTLTLEVQMLARACGKTNIHSLEPEDLAALTTEAAAMARVPLAGTDYMPGREREPRARGDQDDARPLSREPDRRAARSARSGGGMTEHEAREPEKIQSIDAEFLSGERFPYQEDIGLVDDIDLLAATPGEDINWLEDIELLEEEGSPAVFDRYSNSFLKIYFPIPEGRENEIARKVLIAHLQSGNSYGIRLKEQHCKFPQPELGPWVEDSKTVGADWRAPVLEGWEAPLH